MDVLRRSRGYTDIEGAKVGAVKMSMLQKSRSIQEGLGNGNGNGNGEQRWPGVPDTPSGEVSVKRQDPAGVQADPGGKTKLK